METYRGWEKESKIKTFSKEALSSKVDKKIEEKAKIRTWLNEGLKIVTNIKTAYETDLTNLINRPKKARRGKYEQKVAAQKVKLEYAKQQINRVELLIKSLEHETISTETFNDIKDSFQNYLGEPNNSYKKSAWNAVKFGLIQKYESIEDDLFNGENCEEEENNEIEDEENKEETKSLSSINNTETIIPQPGLKTDSDISKQTEVDSMTQTQKFIEENSPPPKSMLPFQSILLTNAADYNTSLVQPNIDAPTIIDMLNTSKNNLPQFQDSAIISPSNPIPFKRIQAQFPTIPMAISSDMLAKFEDDTLFFMFYYQQGTYEQYLAVQELKRREWIYHTKYMTWFRKYEGPEKDKDEKTYLYFDYESGWCQRIKHGFKFEKKYMENESDS